ncbi:MAG: hypothetical protein RLZZ301_1357 [Bacteroidota bacterium]|jgi:antitoxin component YwqK of YwqJK toxin-antitoxin module
MNLKTLALLFFSINSLLARAQEAEPCYKHKPPCPSRSVQNCHDRVAFDEEKNQYVFRKDYATPYSGTCASCFPNGALEEKLNIVEGKREGVDTSYYYSGCPQSIQSYVLGLQDGPTRVFYDSSALTQFEIWYRAGKFDGPSIHFSNNPSHDTLEVKRYSAGKLNGQQLSYGASKHIQRAVSYKNGLLDGPYLTFSENGAKEMQLAYKAGKKHGTWTYYYESGKIAHKETWDNGLKNGDFITYDENGTILEKESYSQDLPVGIHQHYYDDGKLKYQASYTPKGEKIEVFFIDEYGVKKELYKKEVTDKKQKAKSAAEISNEPSEKN